MENKKILKSGEFLVEETEAKNVFIPEEFNEEQKMIAQTCQDFLETEIYPKLNEIDAGKHEIMVAALKKAGELGLLGIALPEEYNGFGQNFVTQMLAAETIGAGYSFSVAFMAHSGIGTLPIAYYGNDEQRKKYVSKLATGEFIGAYCLTEPNAGSDANSGKTQAKLSEDGKNYIINGQKMWITNAGFADVHTVFAKIDNDRCLSAFIVEKNYPGVVINVDEKKMGIKGSSTAQIFYNDVKVPVENLIGTRGEGFRVALTILHMGRIKLGANVLGAAKKAINDSVRYSNERKQFGVLISTFGAIKHKLAEQVVKTFAIESAVYRVSKNIDDLIEQNKKSGMDKGRVSIEAISNYAVEAAILKVYASEVLDFVVDEAVQIHGGMGYSAEMAVEKGYRDSRINRIFEGTNEINRLLVSDTAMKKAMKGEFDLFGVAEKLSSNLSDIAEKKNNNENYFVEKKRYIRNFKKVALLAINAATKKFDKKLISEQEVLNNISDIMMEVYVAESTLLRVEKLETLKGNDEIKTYKDILDVLVFDAAEKVRKSAVDAFSSIEDNADKLIRAANNLTEVSTVNIKNARRRIADKLIEENKYKF
ncbi:MAG: acyl-CoA dehydrogenase family protein [Bacteroidales bacterium]|jgi:alkylation response protein AidB-like acyl-CoA dehydrogenase